MRLTKTFGWSMVAGVLCVLLVAASWFLLVSPQRARAAEARELTAAAQANNSQLEQEIEWLKREYADLGSRQAELAAIRQALPSTPELASLLTTVTTEVEEVGVTLDGVSAGVPVVLGEDSGTGTAAGAEAQGSIDGEDAAAGEDGADAAAGDEAEGEAAEGEAGAEDAGATNVPPAPGQPAPAPTGPVLAAVDLSVTVIGDFGSATLALKELQATMTRAFLVESVAVDVVTDDGVPEGTVELVATGRVFVFADDAELLSPIGDLGGAPGPAGPELTDEPGLVGPEEPGFGEEPGSGSVGEPGGSGLSESELEESVSDAVEPDAVEPALVGSGVQEGTA